MLAVVPAAGAAVPGESVLLSRPSGLGPLDPALFAWNSSGDSNLYPGDTEADITADGRYAVFVTRADGLVGGEDPAPQRIVRKDLQTGATLVVDAGANDSSTDPGISDDGRFVVFSSFASNLVPADSSPDADVFVKDLADGTVRLLSSAAEEDTGIATLHPVISGNGSKVAFATSTVLDATHDANGKLDVYAVNADGSGSPQIVSATPAGAAANGDSALPSISDLGTRVAYISSANNLAGTDTDTLSDIYVRDLGAADSVLASAQDGSPSGTGAGGVQDGEISGDGARVVFTSTTSTYVSGADSDTKADVWRRTLSTKANVLVSVSDSEVNSDQPAYSAATDATGGRVAFTTSSTNVGGTDNGNDLYVRDVAAGQTKVITDGAQGIFGTALTHGTGERVLFAANGVLPDGPTPEAVHAAPILGGSLQLVSVPESGTPLQPGLTDTPEANFTPENHRVSADGRYVVFSSRAPALGGPSDRQVCFRRDVHTGETLRVSPDQGGTPVRCYTTSISADGSKVAFVTDAALDPADSGNDADIYVRDIATGAVTFVSRADTATGVNSDGTMYDAELSADGAHVAFASNATNLGAPGGGFHVYERDLTTATTTVVDRTTAGAIGTAGTFDSTVGIDATGRRVAFATNTHLDPVKDTDGYPDVYVRDIPAGTTTLASVQSTSLGGAKGSLGSLAPTLSGNGNVVAFLGGSPNLDPGAGPIGVVFEVFVRDLAAETTRMASVSPTGVAGNSNAFNAALDDSGDVVAFEANGSGGPSNLSAELDPLTTGIVVRRLSANTTSVVQAGAVSPRTNYAGRTTHPSLSGDGRCVAFFAVGRGLVEGVSPDFAQAYERVLDGDCTTPPVPAAGGGPSAQPPKAPVLSRVSMTHRRFRVGPKRTAVTARRAKVGTTFRFTISDVATVTIRIDRLKKGRRSGTRCVKPTLRLRRHKACTRAQLKGRLTRRALAAGAHRVAFSGRIGRRRLAVGRYRATLTATGTTGLQSTSRTLAFRIVR